MEDDYPYFYNDSSSNYSRAYDAALEVLDKIQYFYTPILVVLGTIGNCFSVYVIFRSKLRKLSSSYYLAALAVSDTVFLASLHVIWLAMNGYDYYNRPIICPLTNYISFVSSSTSAWLVTVFTIERFVAVVSPLKSKSLCTIRRARTIILTLVLINHILYTPIFLSSTPNFDPNSNRTVCAAADAWIPFLFTFNLVDFFVSLCAPMCCVATLNACIAFKVWRFAAMRANISKCCAKRASYAMTKMLLIVSTIFMALSLPSYVVRIGVYLMDMNILPRPVDNSGLILAQHTTNLIFYLNFGNNFLLYCISGQNFRKAIRQVCCLCGSERDEMRLRRNNTYAGTVDYKTQSTELPELKKTFSQKRNVNSFMMTKFDI